MYTLRVEAAFAAAHSLNSYHGKCETLHGHNYRVRLWIRGDSLEEGGMLADFGSLRRILKDTIAQLDHSNLNDNPVFEQNPSAERIARYIFEEASARLSDPNLLFAVDVFETPGSMARYER